MSIKLGPLKLFQQFPLTRRIFVASFIEIPPINRDIVSHEIVINKQTTDGQINGRKTQLLSCLLVAEAKQIL